MTRNSLEKSMYLLVIALLAIACFLKFKCDTPAGSLQGGQSITSHSMLDRDTIWGDAYPYAIGDFAPDPDTVIIRDTIYTDSTVHPIIN